MFILVGGIGYATKIRFNTKGWWAFFIGGWFLTSLCAAIIGSDTREPPLSIFLPVICYVVAIFVVKAISNFRMIPGSKP